MWSRSGSTSYGEIDERLVAAEQGRDPPLPGQQRRGAEDEPGEGRRAGGGAEDADLGLLQLRAVEGQRRDQQRDGEADAGDRAGARDGRPADRRSQPPARQPRHEQRRADDAERLADHVAEQDAERDRRAGRALERGRRRSRCPRWRARTAGRSRSSSMGDRAARSRSFGEIAVRGPRAPSAGAPAWAARGTRGSARRRARAPTGRRGRPTPGGPSRGRRPPARRRNRAAPPRSPAPSTKYTGPRRRASARAHEHRGEEADGPEQRAELARPRCRRSRSRPARAGRRRRRP